jgi:hypothetical protein
MHVVSFPIELAKLGTQVCANVSLELLAVGEQWVVEDEASVCGDTPGERAAW